jgi:3-hydroxyisobutyrate dehydrogenase-like beta-hydroxyacid dehydrogenase
VRCVTVVCYPDVTGRFDGARRERRGSLASERVARTHRCEDACEQEASELVKDAIGVLHPGEMGAGITAELTAKGLEVCFASAGRSEATRARAARAGLRDLQSVEAIFAECELVFSICPPDSALEVAALAGSYRGRYVDANAISPRTARAVAAVVEAGGARYIDGGIIGNPPSATSRCRFVLSGDGAEDVAELFSGTQVDARVVSKDPSAASAVKVGYAAWTKGSTALLLAVRAYARAAGVEEALIEEWSASQPDLLERSVRAAPGVGAKAWRWAGEMEEIAVSLGDEGLPAGFHTAAAEVYRALSPAGSASALRSLDELLGALVAPVVDTAPE